MVKTTKTIVKAIKAMVNKYLRSQAFGNPWAVHLKPEMARRREKIVAVWRGKEAEFMHEPPESDRRNGNDAICVTRTC
jgi:hypothetical protein